MEVAGLPPRLGLTRQQRQLPLTRPLRAKVSVCAFAAQPNNFRQSFIISPADFCSLLQKSAGPNSPTEQTGISLITFLKNNSLLST